MHSRLRLFVAAALLGALLLVPAAGGGSAAVLLAKASPLEAFVQACPAAGDIAQIDSKLTLTFDKDPTAGTVVCTAAQSGRDLTLLQERAYQTLGLIQRTQFARALPWTGGSLYDWLTHAIRGIDFRGDSPYGTSIGGWCCDAPNTISIATSTRLAFLQTASPWNRPSFAANALAGSWLGLFVHEARHSEGVSHTCGPTTPGLGLRKDQSPGEGGAFAYQFDLDLWIAMYSDAFYDAGGPRSLNRADAFRSAAILAPNFCTYPTADISLQTRAAASNVTVGKVFALTSTIANAGPDDSPQTWFSIDVPDNTSLEGSTTSQGSCIVVAGDRVSCDLGALAAAKTATVVLSLRANAAGTIRYAPPVLCASCAGDANDLMAYAIGAVNDVTREGGPSPNNEASAVMTVGPQGTTPNVTVTVVVQGKGRVFGRGFNCAASCKTPFASGAKVVLQTSAERGYRFAGWSGACTGLGACTLYPKAPVKVTAVFRKRS